MSSSSTHLSRRSFQLQERVRAGKTCPTAVGETKLHGLDPTLSELSIYDVSMREGTLEKPYSLGDRSAPPIKCLKCDSKSFAIHLPKDLDEDYKECFDQEEREARFPKLFRDPIDTGEFYHCVLVTCSKCGESLTDKHLFFKSLGDWKPPRVTP